MSSGWPIAAVAVIGLLGVWRRRAARVTTLVVWDFDWSLLNENSDTYVIAQLAPRLRDEMRVLQATPEFGRGRWTALMDHVLGRLARERGVTPAAIAACVAAAPLDAATAAAVRRAGASGRAEQRILSDANDFFIAAVLDARALRAHFSRVVTNPSRLERRDAGGPAALRVAPLVPASAPHGCARCPPNLCKGRVLDAWRAEPRAARFGRVVYVGDGGGDACPALRLGAADVVCARRDWALHKALAREGCAARVLPWSDGDELFAHFDRLFAA